MVVKGGAVSVVEPGEVVVAGWVREDSVSASCADIALNTSPECPVSKNGARPAVWQWSVMGRPTIT